jgi:predicted HTH transcriptional regulator
MSVFSSVNKLFTKATAKTLELFIEYQENQYPTRGGLLLFGKDRDQLFPDPFVRLARFKGITKTGIIDQAEMKSPLPIIVDEILAFIHRNTSLEQKLNLLVEKIFQNILPQQCERL